MRTGPESSIAKLSYSEQNKRSQELIQEILGPYGQIQHGNIDLDSGPVNAVLATPERHRWHHSTVVAEGNTNYGAIVATWDRLMGTAWLPADRPFDADVGIGGEHVRGVIDRGFRRIGHPADVVRRGQTAPRRADGCRMRVNGIGNDCRHALSAEGLRQVAPILPGEGVAGSDDFQGVAPRGSVQCKEKNRRENGPEKKRADWRSR